VRNRKLWVIYLFAFSGYSPCIRAGVTETAKADTKVNNITVDHPVSPNPAAYPARGITPILAAWQRHDQTSPVSQGSAAASPSAACGVKSVTKLFGPIGQGFALSPDGKTLAYAKTVGGIDQLYIRTLSTGNERCVTCTDRSGAPTVYVHKGAPAFHPDCNHIALEVEMPDHPFKGRVGRAGPGWFTNIWMTTVDGNRWWQLTDYPHGDRDRTGALLPRISRDGSKIAWGYLYAGDPVGQAAYARRQIIRHSHPFGLWKLAVADLVMDSEGPRVKNTSWSKPGDGSFYEPQDWSPDSRTLLFASDIGRDYVTQLDIWSLNLVSSQLKPVMHENGWEEFAQYSPDGRKVAFMSSECCDWDPLGPNAIPFTKSLLTELFLADANGSNNVQLTHFNDQFPGRNIVTSMQWFPDGGKIIFCHVPSLWLLTFDGACGNRR